MKRGAQTLGLCLVALLIGVGLLHLRTVYGDQLPSRSIKLSQGITGATDTYQAGFTLPAAETLGSVRLEFCSESPLIGQPCTIPTGMNLAGVTLGSQTGGGTFSIASVNTTTIILTRIPTAVAANTAYSFTFNGIVNPSNAGSYFGRIRTYPSIDASGANTDYGGIAYSLASAVQISATVPPYLYFCLGITITNVDCTTATGDQIDFGNFSVNVASTAETQMVAGTNADTGYIITANGLTLTSGNNVIPAIDTTDTSRPGTSQFGINVVANQDPQVGQNPSGAGNGIAATNYDQPNRYRFVTGEVVAKATAPDYARKYTTSYVANIAKPQAAGVYVTTFTYIATAGF